MNKKWLETIEKNYGSLDNYRKANRSAAIRGGSAKVKKGFAKFPKDKLIKAQQKGRDNRVKK